MSRFPRAVVASGLAGARWVIFCFSCPVICSELPDRPKDYFGWSQYRYTRYDEAVKPGPNDKESAILAGGDVKCEVCKTILLDVLQQLAGRGALTGAGTYDAILEALEADHVDEDAVRGAPSQMEAYVEKHKTGCNKLFKDNYLARGFGVVSCTRLAEGQDHWTLPEDQAPWACSKRETNLPNGRDLNTYSVQKEAAHYACARTIGDHRDHLATFLAAKLKRGGENTTELAGEACRKKAKCLERKSSESPEARVKKVQEKAQQQSNEVDELLAKVERRTKKQAQKRGGEPAGKTGAPPGGDGDHEDTVEL